jgi:hypothetical protein
MPPALQTTMLVIELLSLLLACVVGLANNSLTLKTAGQTVLL